MILWDTIMSKLEQWKAEQEPAVNTVAAQTKRDPWAVLVSTIISLRTKDAVTLARSKVFLEAIPDPSTLCTIPTERAAQLIYPAGFYRTKATNLKRIAAILVEQYDKQVPDDIDRLLALPGVGRKTANLVLVEAFDKDGICVDVHVHRISNRTGWLTTKNPEQTEDLLRRILPRIYWKRINTVLVLYGQQVCRPISPFCSGCVIRPHCERRGVGRSR
ncbi:MAG: endonuclease III [Spirochaetaceae bacterium]|jgi:endonuclease-3|nr:endonuclease III [Spirochaetaceae bacterium]